MFTFDSKRKGGKLGGLTLSHFSHSWKHRKLQPLPVSEGMSGFGVFLRIVAIVAAFYLIAGAAYNHYVYGAKGLDLIPNIGNHHDPRGVASITLIDWKSSWINIAPPPCLLVSLLCRLLERLSLSLGKRYPSYLGLCYRSLYQQGRNWLCRCVAAFGVVAVVAFILFFFLKKKKKKVDTGRQDSVKDI